MYFVYLNAMQRNKEIENFAVKQNNAGIVFTEYIAFDREIM